MAITAVGFIFEVFLRQRDVLLTLAAATLVAGVAAVALARRWSRPLPLVLAALLGLAVIPTFTLVPELGYGEYGRAVWSASRIELALGNGWSGALGGWAQGTDGPLNVALYLPAGMFLTLATRRPVRVLFVLAGLSLVIEVLQAWSGLRSATPQDVGGNVLGAGIGMGIAMVVITRSSGPRTKRCLLSLALPLEDPPPTRGARSPGRPGKRSILASPAVSGVTTPTRWTRAE